MYARRSYRKRTRSRASFSVLLFIGDELNCVSVCVREKEKEMRERDRKEGKHRKFVLRLYCFIDNSAIEAAASATATATATHKYLLNI